MIPGSDAARYVTDEATLAAAAAAHRLASAVRGSCALIAETATRLERPLLRRARDTARRRDLAPPPGLGRRDDRR